MILPESGQLLQIQLQSSFPQKMYFTIDLTFNDIVYSVKLNICFMLHTNDDDFNYVTT